MPNSWFYYSLPLFLSMAFFLAGLAMFRGIRRDRVYGGYLIRNQAGAGFRGVLFMLTGGSLGLAIVLGSPSPWKRQALFDHVFRTPPERIERFVIEATPNAYRPLTTSPVEIDDAPRIRRIADLLRTAREVSPNHPHAKWTTNVTMVTRDGTYHFEVEYTSERRNGTLVHLSSQPDGSGWNFGEARADGLETLLEEAANSAAAR